MLAVSPDHARFLLFNSRRRLLKRTRSSLAGQEQARQSRLGRHKATFFYTALNSTNATFRRMTHHFVALAIMRTIIAFSSLDSSHRITCQLHLTVLVKRLKATKIVQCCTIRDRRHGVLNWAFKQAYCAGLSKSSSVQPSAKLRSLVMPNASSTL
eukprot:6176956-Pleurochrysis_carterae.AAC.1